MIVAVMILAIITACAALLSWGCTRAYRDGAVVQYRSVTAWAGLTVLLAFTTVILAVLAVVQGTGS